MPKQIVDDFETPLSENATFEEWFNRFEWWHENSRREDMGHVWGELRDKHGLTPKQTAAVMETVIFATADEYGD